MNQNPNNPDYNPYAQPPSGPNYPPTPDARYGAPPIPSTNPGGYGPVSGPGSGANYDGYIDQTVPSTDPRSNPYNANAPYAPPVQNNPTQYGPYGDPTVPPPPPPMQNYSSPGYPPLSPPLYPQVPSSPPPNRRGRTTLVVIIVLVVIAASAIVGGVAYHSNQVAIQNNATATAQVQSTAQAQVTGTAQSHATATAVASTFPFFAHQALNDPLISNSNAQAGWETGRYCAFAGNAYQVSNDQKDTYIPCVGLKTSFSDFTLQVDMTMKQGDSQSAGGLYFRANESKAQGYLFDIDQQGNYTLWIATDTTGGNSRTLKQGQITTSQFATGLFQSNTIAVAVRGTQISLYAGQQLIVTIPDSTYSIGEIGFISTDIVSKTVVTFSNVKVWTA